MAPPKFYQGAVNRREFVIGSATCGAALTFGGAAAGGEPAGPSIASAWLSNHVREIARKLSLSPYKPTPEFMAPAVANIGYDQWRDIVLKPKHVLWGGEGRGFELQFWPTGYIYRTPVKIFVADGRDMAELGARRSMFFWGQLEEAMAPDEPIAFSGFRVHSPLNQGSVNGKLDEVVVFQGASYFRALGQGHHYGLSARGLALDPLSPKGEEFPQFTAFWIETPRDPSAIVVHALLDSPSVAGAYAFTIRPGPATTMETRLTLFPRVELTGAGIAPFSSMFWHGTHQPGPRDFRPSVHDSDGLLMRNGAGEQLWRPILNPTRIEVSAFLDKDPPGFGLFQRNRDFAAYQDLEAQQERRPSAWIEPLGKWREGHVELIELPTKNEYADNIVAYWRPKDPLRAGEAYDYAYRLAWTSDDPPGGPWLRVSGTRIGEGPKPGVLRFIVEFEKSGAGATGEFPPPLWGRVREGGNPNARSGIPPPLTPPHKGEGDLGVLTAADSVNALDLELLGYQAGVAGPGEGQWRAIEADLSASGPGVGAPFVQHNPHIDGVRVIFDVDPKDQTTIEMRLSLSLAREKCSEVWMYRWVR